MKTYNEIFDFLKENNQEHLLRFYNELDTNQRTSLFSQIEKIDFDFMKELYDNRNIISEENKLIDKIPYKKESEISPEDKKRYTSIGEELIRNGKVAVCQLAGGQGTRLRI